MGAPEALIETWTLYAAGTVIIALRAFSRTKLVGFRGYRLDDYLIWVAWGAYTTMTVAAHIVGGVGDTSHLSMEERLAMTPQQRQSRSLGSKWFMVGWYTYITLIWTLKFNMLVLYQRVVKNVWVEKFIMPCKFLVVGSAITIYIMFAVGCRPFNHLWQVLPDPGPYCAPQSPVFLIVVLVFNLVTDICIMLIPAPVIIPLKTTLPRKIGLLLLFGGGAFVMIAAVLRVYYVLVQKQGGVAAIWSCREDIIAVLIGQATMIRPIFSRRFWGGKNSSSHNSSYPSKPGQGTEGHEMSVQSRQNAFRKKFSKPKDPYNVSVLETRNDSEERIVKDDGEGAYSDLRSNALQGHGPATVSTRTTSSDQDNKINVSTTVDIQNLGDVEAGIDPNQKPNYGHNSRVQSRWHAF